MKDLVKIERRDGIPTVNARELHEWLCVGRDFSSWIKGRIEKYGFYNGKDYFWDSNLSVPKSGNPKARIQKTIDYYLSYDMANKLILIEAFRTGLSSLENMDNKKNQELPSDEAWTIVNNMDELSESACPGFYGCVYIAEYGDKVKIGFTKNIKLRFRSLSHTAKFYSPISIGRIAYSPWHTNYSGNEKYLHHYFKQWRINGCELFNIGLDYILANLPEMEYMNRNISETVPIYSILGKYLSIASADKPINLFLEYERTNKKSMNDLLE